MQWEAVGGRWGVAVCAAMGLGLGALAWQVNARQAAVSEPPRTTLAQPAPTRALPPAEQVQQAIARAEPLLAMLRAGMVLSDDTIADADADLVEPLLRAHAAHQRDVVALAVAHEEAGAALPLEPLLSPAALGAPGQRAVLRAQAARRAAAAALYAQQLQAAGEHGRQRLQAALLALPAGHFDGALQAFDADQAALQIHAQMQHASARDAQAAIVALLDAIESGRAVPAYQEHLAAARQAFARERAHDARLAGTPLIGTSYLR
jgi:hypothetical protein